MQRTPKFSLPVAAMLVAALSGYLGLPQLELLSRVAPDVVMGARLAQPVLRSIHQQRLAKAAEGSAEAEQLEREREAGKRALSLIGAAPNFAAATAPTFAPSAATVQAQPPAIAAGDTPVAAWIALATTPELVKPPPGTAHLATTSQYSITLRSPRGPPALA